MPVQQAAHCRAYRFRILPVKRKLILRWGYFPLKKRYEKLCLGLGIVRICNTKQDTVVGIKEMVPITAHGRWEMWHRMTRGTCGKVIVTKLTWDSYMIPTDQTSNRLTPHEYWMRIKYQFDHPVLYESQESETVCSSSHRTNHNLGMCTLQVSDELE